VVDTWLMSCRVLKRGVETFAQDCLCRQAIEMGIGKIRGEYVPTAKNDLVKNHYASLGFAQTAADDNGHTWWEFALPPDWIPQAVFIELDGDLELPPARKRGPVSAQSMEVPQREVSAARQAVVT
jgi:predicted enzyme involved in methoxymalonyl-ACP biosynthesis